MSLPRGGHREDTTTTEVLQKYIRDNVDKWYSWAQRNRLGVERLEDLILVSGCTLVTSWAAAAYLDHTLDTEISLKSSTLSNGGTNFVWSNVRGTVVHYNSLFDPVRTPVYNYSTCTNFSFIFLLYGKQNPHTTPDQCVFIRGFRAKRALFRTKLLRAAAEPLPDDTDNSREDEIQMTRVPSVPKVGNLRMWVVKKDA